MHERYRRYKKAARTKEPEDWLLAKQSRNLVNNMCKRAKEEYVKMKLEEDKGDPRKFWSHLKPLFNDEDSKSTAKIELEEASDSVPNTFNKFFTSIGMKIQKNIKPLTP